MPVGADDRRPRQPHGDRAPHGGARWTDDAAVILTLLACLAIPYIFLRISERLVRWLGKTGADVVGRISGILLAALAVQFVFDGIRQGHLAGG